jgi:hypothetical protein
MTIFADLISISRGSDYCFSLDPNELVGTTATSQINSVTVYQADNACSGTSQLLMSYPGVAGTMRDTEAVVVG